MKALQILIDGFAISALYGLGAVGFTLMFGVSGVLNLAHGATMVVAAVTAWVVAEQLAASPWIAAVAGTATGVVMAFATYFLVVRPIQRSKSVPETEKEIFIIIGTLLWGIMIKKTVPYFNN